MILAADLREARVHVGPGGAVGCRGLGGVTALLVVGVGRGVFLLLEGDGEAEVAVFLAEGWVV